MSVKDNAEHIGKVAAEIEQISSGTNMALTEMRIQFETLAEMQKEERIETQKMHNDVLEKTRKHYAQIILGLIVTLCLIIGGIIGSVIYFFSNYEIATFEQYLTSGNDEYSVIFDGIHYGDGN